MLWTKSGKSTRGSRKALLLIFVIWGWCFDCRWVRIDGIGQKVSFTFSFLVLLKEMRTRGQSKTGFHLFTLLWVKITKAQGEFRILLCNPSGRMILFRASASYIKLLGRVALRILLSIHNEAPPAKTTNGLKKLTVSTEKLHGRH